MAPVVIVAQASLPAIRLWIVLQRLAMAGRDAHPTIVNKSPYLNRIVLLKIVGRHGDPPGLPYGTFLAPRIHDAPVWPPWQIVTVPPRRGLVEAEKN
jgi:hypothetical protein